MTRHLFDLVDPDVGSVRCRECGAVDMVTTDTWTGDFGVEGFAICGSCNSSDDIHALPFDWRDI